MVATWCIVAFLHSDCHYALLFKMDLNGGKEKRRRVKAHRVCGHQRWRWDVGEGSCKRGTIIGR